MSDERSLQLVGAPNARELGGLPADDGQRVRPGMLVRTSALGRVTEADLPALARFGLACRIDLRHASEIAQAPPDRLPDPSPRLVHLPVFDRAHPVFTYVSAVLLGHDLRGYTGLVNEGSPGAMAAIYRWFVTGKSARAGFAAALRLLADPANLPAVFHCSAGKDRTGWLTVILLTVLGVEPDAIRDDYLRSNADNALAQQALLELLLERRPGADSRALRPVLEVRPEYLEAGLAEVARRYGSFDGYLRAGLGLDDGVLAALRRQLLV